MGVTLRTIDHMNNQDAMFWKPKSTQGGVSFPTFPSTAKVSATITCCQDRGSNPLR